MKFQKNILKKYFYKIKEEDQIPQGEGCKYKYRYYNTYAYEYYYTFTNEKSKN